ncbi:MAG: glycosyltransferase [Deltaproteobacteria bacterium]|nr:glycosyltransferase [Deltaproteobacteria bacterium]
MNQPTSQPTLPRVFESQPPATQAAIMVAQARSLLAFGEPGAAARLLSGSMHLAPHSVDLLQTLADCFLAQSDLASVKDTMEYARRLHPDDVDIAARIALSALAGLPANEPAVQAPPIQAQAHKPTCVFINTYYPAFLASFRARQPGLANAPYEKQKADLLGTCFGDSDFYSSGLRKAGWIADELVVNDVDLAQAWSQAHGFSFTQPLDVAVEQIRRLRPDVVYLQDLGIADTAFVSRIRPYTQLIVGQIASPMPPQTDLRGFDLIITSFPHFADRLRQAGVTAYYQPLAFSRKVLDRAKPGARTRPLTFVGGLSPQHPAGTELLNRLAQSTNIEIWGYGAAALPPDSAIRARHRGEAWGEDMFRLLAESQITVNRHIAVAENHANNMRLFEATGCGALLITDYKDNLQDLFDIGKEVVAYRSPQECEALIQYYQAHPAEAEQIAKAGQARTWRDHSYDARLQDTAAILERHLRHKREVDAFAAVDLGAVSTAYRAMDAAHVTPALIDAWKNEQLPQRQRALVHRELGEMYKGRDVVPFKVLADALNPELGRMPAGTKSLLEIGCASGYYFEVLRFLCKQPIAYTGVDYSPAMIAMAKDYYPQATFSVEDGAKLPFADRSFDVVVSSCVLLHVPNYREHIQETARVARDLVVVHRTPVSRRQPTKHLHKQGYGVDMVELQFNETELNQLWNAAGFTLVSGIQYHADEAADEYGVTYVYKKVA